MGGDSQVGDLPKSQNGILQFLEKGAGCGFYELVPQRFFQFMVQLKSPSIFAVEMGGFGDLFRSGHGTMDWRSSRFYRYNGICGGCGGSILGIAHCESKVTMESATEWNEDGCRIAVEFGTGFSDDLEGGFCGSMGNWC